MFLDQKGRFPKKEKKKRKKRRELNNKDAQELITYSGVFSCPVLEPHANLNLKHRFAGEKADSVKQG